jgi:hypothetical protein
VSILEVHLLTTKGVMQHTISLLDIYKYALQDFPYPEFKVPGRLHRRKRGDYQYTNYCTFDPRQLVKDCFSPSALHGKKNHWGWGFIDVREETEDGERTVSIEGMFHVENQNDWTKGRFYSEDRAFWGHYDTENRIWTFHFGR